MLASLLLDGLAISNVPGEHFVPSFALLVLTPLHAHSDFSHLPLSTLSIHPAMLVDHLQTQIVIVPEPPSHLEKCINRHIIWELS